MENPIRPLELFKPFKYRALALGKREHQFNDELNAEIFYKAGYNVYINTDYENEVKAFNEYLKTI